MDGETKIGQDSLQEAGRTSPEVVSPSTQSVKTYTEAEVAERHSKLDKMIAQLTRERDTLKQDNETTKQQLADIQRRRDEQEEEEARADPDSFKIYQRQKQLRESEARLKEQQRQIEADRLLNADKLRRADELETDNILISSALEHHIDIGILQEKVKKFNLTTEEQIAEMASTLASSAKKVPPKGDSGLSVGGKDLDNMSASELIKLAVRQQKK